jgi:hypothetical protein
MTEYKIHPNIGVNDLRFGMTVFEVRRLLNGDFESFKRNIYSGYPCDYFLKLNCFAYYKSSGLLEALEFVDDANLLFAGERLLNAAAADAKKALESVDKSVEMDFDGATSYLLGIGFYAPGWDDDDTVKVESVIVFEKGYYD